MRGAKAPGRQSRSAAAYGRSSAGVAPGKRTLASKVYTKRGSQRPPALHDDVESTEADQVAVDNIEGTIRRKASNNEVSTGARSAVNRANSADAGEPLPEALQEPLGASLGADLSSVRVHAGSASAAASCSLGARAFTTGQDIHFAAGEYEPASKEGQRLIAHEAAHAAAPESSGDPRRKLEVSAPGDAQEVEADRFADSFVEEGAGPFGRSTTPRQPTHVRPVVVSLKKKPGKSTEPEPRTWDPPLGCPPAFPKGMRVNWMTTGNLGDLIRFLLRGIGVGESWPGWQKIDQFVSPVRWRAGLAKNSTRSVFPSDGSQISVTAALATVSGVAAKVPTFRGSFALEVNLQITDDEVAHGECPEDESVVETRTHTRHQSIQTGTIEFTVPEDRLGQLADPAHPPMCEDEPDADADGASGSTLSGGTSGKEPSPLPPPIPLPPPFEAPLRHEVRMEMVPDYAAEYGNLKAQTEAGLARELNAEETLRLQQLTLQRTDELKRLDLHEKLAQACENDLAELRHKEYIFRLYDAGLLKEPRKSFARHLWHQFTGGDDGRQGPIGAIKTIGKGVEQTVEESGRLREEAIERGDYAGAAFTPISAIAIESIEAIQDGLQMTRKAIEERLEAKDFSDRVVSELKIVLGVGQTAVGIWGLVEPVANLRKGRFGPGSRRGPKGALATAAAGQSRSSRIVAAASETVAAGSLSQQSVIIAVAGLSDLGEGVEDGMHEETFEDAAKQERNDRLATERTLPEDSPRTELAREVPPPGQTFDEWFDALTEQELDQYLADGSSRRTGATGAKRIIADNIRHPRGMHEWLMVAEARKLKSWGVSMAEIKRNRTLTKATIGRRFRHGGTGSTTFHNDLRQMIRGADSYDGFLEELNIWADRELVPSNSRNWPNEGKRGRFSLPDELQVNAP